MRVADYLLRFLQTGDLKSKTKHTHKDGRCKPRQRQSDDVWMINHTHFQSLVPVSDCRWQCRPLVEAFGLREKVSEDQQAGEESYFQSLNFYSYA